MDANIRSVTNLFIAPISYRIPHFQRPYCWEEERQWEPLWQDVRHLADQQDRTRSHFMGAIVIQQQNSLIGEVQKYLVIDGQQRLSTLQLLLRAAATAFETVGEQLPAARMKELTCNAENYSDGNPDNLVKIRQADKGDRAAFRAVMHDQIDEATQASTIEEAYTFFSSKIEAWLRDSPLLQSQSERAESLESVLTERLKITSIDLDQKDEAYTIFATLNDRGVNLESADIIKNMLMQKYAVGDNEEKAQQVWGAFQDKWWREKTRENNLARTQTARFLDHWLLMHDGRIRTRPERLPVEFNNFLARAQTDIDDVIAKLNQAAPVYRQIHEGTLPDVKSFLHLMHDLKVGAPMTMILALSQKVSTAETWTVVAKVTESYIIRRHLAGKPTNGLPNLFATLVGKLRHVEEGCVGKSIVRYLAHETTSNMGWPTDTEIVQYLSTHPLKGTSRAKRVILFAIEQHLRSAKTEAINDARTLTLEHIMPQKWKTHWPLPQNREADRLLRNRAVQSIGNLTLTTQPLNASTRNKSWHAKKPELLAYSTLCLNQQLLQDSTTVWDETTITKRAEKLAKIAVEVWPNPESCMAQMRKTI